jgi:uncharacterized protein
MQRLPFLLICVLAGFAVSSGRADDQELINAIREGDHTAVRVLLQANEDLKQRHKPTETFLKSPLMEAIARRQKDIVILLLAHEANLEEIHHSLGSPLCQAAAVGDVAIVDLLVAAGANVDPATDHSPLMRAAWNGHAAVCKRLIRAGAKVDLQRDQGRDQSALMLAAKQGHSQVVRCLLDAGANPNLLNISSGGQTALIAAAIYGHADTMRILIAGNAKLDVRDSRGKNALTYALESGNKRAVKVLQQAGLPADPSEIRRIKRDAQKRREAAPKVESPSQEPGRIEDQQVKPEGASPRNELTSRS